MFASLLFDFTSKVFAFDFFLTRKKDFFCICNTKRYIVNMAKI